MVSLLGDLQIAVRGEVVGSGLRSVAKELLTWYALRPEGASVEVAVEALWPDTDPKLVHRQFWTAAANLRNLAELDVDPEQVTLRLHRALVSEDDSPAGRRRAARLQASRPGMS